MTGRMYVIINGLSAVRTMCAALACTKRLRIMTGPRERDSRILHAELSDKCNVAKDRDMIHISLCKI